MKQMRSISNAVETMDASTVDADTCEKVNNSEENDDEEEGMGSDTRKQPHSKKIADNDHTILDEIANETPTGTTDHKKDQKWDLAEDCIREYNPRDSISELQEEPMEEECDPATPHSADLDKVPSPKLEEDAEKGTDEDMVDKVSKDVDGSKEIIKGKVNEGVDGSKKVTEDKLSEDGDGSKEVMEDKGEEDKEEGKRSPSQMSGEMLMSAESDGPRLSQGFESPDKAVVVAAILEPVSSVEDSEEEDETDNSQDTDQPQKGQLDEKYVAETSEKDSMECEDTYSSSKNAGVAPTDADEESTPGKDMAEGRNDKAGGQDAEMGEVEAGDKVHDTKADAPDEDVKETEEVVTKGGDSTIEDSSDLVEHKDEEVMKKDDISAKEDDKVPVKKVDRNLDVKGSVMEKVDHDILKDVAIEKEDDTIEEGDKDSVKDDDIILEEESSTEQEASKGKVDYDEALAKLTSIAQSVKVLDEDISQNQNQNGLAVCKGVSKKRAVVSSEDGEPSKKIRLEAADDSSDANDTKDLETKEKVEETSGGVQEAVEARLKKALASYTRAEVEALVAKKVVEVITARSEVGRLRERCNRYDEQNERWRRKVQALEKMCLDLNTVMRRYILEVKNIGANGGRPRGVANQATPIKITRSVGLQVMADQRQRRPPQPHQQPQAQPQPRQPQPQNQPKPTQQTRPQGRPNPVLARLPQQPAQKAAQQDQQRTPNRTLIWQSQPGAAEASAASNPTKSLAIISTAAGVLPLGSVATTTVAAGVLQPTPGEARLQASSPFLQAARAGPGQLVALQPPHLGTFQFRHLMVQQPAQLQPQLPIQLQKQVARPRFPTPAALVTSLAPTVTSAALALPSSIQPLVVNRTLMSGTPMSLTISRNQVPVVAAGAALTNGALMGLAPSSSSSSASNPSPSSSTLTSANISVTGPTSVVLAAAAAVAQASKKVIDVVDLSDDDDDIDVDVDSGSGRAGGTNGGAPRVRPPATPVSALPEQSYIPARPSPPLQLHQTVPTVINRTRLALPSRSVVVNAAANVQNGIAAAKQRVVHLGGQASSSRAIFSSGPATPSQQGVAAGAGAAAAPAASASSPAQATMPPNKVVPPAGAAQVLTHPGPLPDAPIPQNFSPLWKKAPPKPNLKISRLKAGIVLSWNMDLSVEHEAVVSYQIYAYQEGNLPANQMLWKKVGDVKALPLPMACTLTQFAKGNKYHFAVRAQDIHSRMGLFSEPQSIALL